MRCIRLLVAGVAAVALAAFAPLSHRPSATGTFELIAGAGPFFPGSRVSVQASGFQGPFTLSVLGPGRVEGNVYIAPDVASRTTAELIASARGAVATRRITIVPAPAAGRPLLAVASYDDGIALHDPRTFALLGFAEIGGAPGDVAFAKNGDIVAPDTDGDTLVKISREPWSLARIEGVSEGNEIALDPRSGDVFVSDRDAGPTGAVTRVTPGGAVALVATGLTAEGLSIDERRGLVYVGNVNEPRVAVVDARTMRLVRTLPSVDRAFGIALDPQSQRLYVVSNSSPGMNAHGGYVVEIDTASGRVVKRSKYFTFPLGAVYDASRRRLFVTDEAANVLYVLNAKTLAPVRKPLATCRTPWRPSIAGNRLFVPCARADRVDVFDLRTLRRAAGAPFRTGSFPLSVAVWQ